MGKRKKPYAIDWVREAVGKGMTDLFEITSYLEEQARKADSHREGAFNLLSKRGAATIKDVAELIKEASKELKQ